MNMIHRRRQSIRGLCLGLWTIFLLGGQALGQITPISGVINDTQTRVLQADTSNHQLIVTDASGFEAEDRILIIQMKGASMNEENDISFGELQDYNGAGMYEITTLCGTQGDTLKLKAPLLHAYEALADTASRVQVIKVPRYDNAVVTDTLTAPAWNGTTGGVLILEATKLLRLEAPIDVTGKGFRGGPVFDAPDDCKNGTSITPNSAVFNDIDYFYQGNTTEGAWKGEGIAGYIPEKEGGKGRQINGGGGGNNHNSGGGGGGNYGAGGVGGTREGLSNLGLFCRGYHPGKGGAALPNEDPAELRLFMGGGGGSGHTNNDEGAPGAHGGGIAILIAGFMEPQKQTIFANGAHGLDTGEDGAPGGGGGGSILLQVEVTNGDSLYLEAKGGNGGKANEFNGRNCLGPGGGGGGGIVALSFVPQPGDPIVSQVAGGEAGVDGSTSDCAGERNGAENGTDGASFTGVAVMRPASQFLTCEQTTSIRELEDLHFQWNILPNPSASSEPLLLKTHLPRGGMVAIRILDLAGRTLQQSSYRQSAGEHQTVIQDVPTTAGHYLIEMGYEGTISYRKWVKY